MSIYSGGEKYYGLAQGVDARAYHLEEQIAHMQSNRALLAEIRKARLAAAQSEYMYNRTSSDYIQASGQDAATAGVYSTFGGAYGYSMNLNTINSELQDMELLSHTLKKKGATADKRAATATQITMAVLAAAGGVIGGLAAGAVAGGMSATTGAGIGIAAGGAVGAGSIRAVGGGKVARKVANKAAVNYAITGATIAAGGALADSVGGGAETGVKTVTDVTGQASNIAANSGGQITMTNAAYTGATTSTTSTAWLSSAKQIGEGLSTASNIKSMLTPDYSYSEDRYKKSLYRQRYNRIYG